MKLLDEVAIRKCLDGDESAFGLLVEKYQSAIYGLCYHMTGNYADAQDIAQEAFIKAYMELSNIREPAKFANWLNRIAVNACNMWLRSQRTANGILTGMAIHNIARYANFISPIENIHAEELRASINEALESLSEGNRNVIKLFYLDGLSCNKIAISLGLSQYAVKNRLFRARRQLREELVSMMNDFAKNAIREVANHAGLGIFQIDTISGNIRLVNSGSREAEYFKQLGVASAREPDTYIPYENKSGAGLYVLNSATGEVWWTNGTDSQKPGKPYTEPGKAGTYAAYENELGAGFRIIDTRTGDTWWTNGDIWGEAGKMDLEVLSMTEDQKAEMIDLLYKTEELFGDEKFAEAIVVCQHIFSQYPFDPFYHIHTLMMTGLCYERMGKRQKSVKILERIVGTYSDVIGFLSVPYFHLGNLYADMGQKQKAFIALKKCIELCVEDGRKPGYFPYKDATDAIIKLNLNNN